MTWDIAAITKEHIAGTIPDLRRLSELIPLGLEKHNVGDSFTIDKEFGTRSEVKLIIKVLQDNFDPVSMDNQLAK
jgi:hypothetical protein